MEETVPQNANGCICLSYVYHNNGILGFIEFQQTQNRD